MFVSQKLHAKLKHWGITVAILYILQRFFLQFCSYLKTTKSKTKLKWFLNGQTKPFGSYQRALYMRNYENMKYELWENTLKSSWAYFLTFIYLTPFGLQYLNNPLTDLDHNLTYKLILLFTHLPNFMNIGSTVWQLSKPLAYIFLVDISSC